MSVKNGKTTGRNLVKKFFAQRETSVLIIILIAVAIVQIIQPKFLNVSNLKSIALSVSTDGLLSIGLCLALILGGIDRVFMFSRSQCMGCLSGIGLSRCRSRAVQWSYD